jgi:hypothetical protein
VGGGFCPGGGGGGGGGLGVKKVIGLLVAPPPPPQLGSRKGSIKTHYFGGGNHFNKCVIVALPAIWMTPSTNVWASEKK